MLGASVAGYRVESVAGRGGMGVVYLARQTALDRPVALKLIAPTWRATRPSAHASPASPGSRPRSTTRT
jgi:hypothetical protein